MNPQLLSPICQEITWKLPEMRAFALELVRGALRTNGEGFTTDIVPEESRPASPGVPGSVVELLKNANLIEPVGTTVGGKWYPERRRSGRPGCRGRYVQVYRLISPALARAWLRRQGADDANPQLRLTL